MKTYNTIDRLGLLFAQVVLACNVWHEKYSRGTRKGQIKPDGWADCGCKDNIHSLKDDEGYSIGYPDYTSSLDAAWQGVELLVKSGFDFELMWVEGGDFGTGWLASATFINNDWSVVYRYCKENPAEAVVLVCLRAYGVSEEVINAAYEEA